MKIADFDYNLPKDLIAQYPLDQRDQSRLLVLDRKNSQIIHKKFYDIIDFLSSGDLLVLNNTKVILARLFGNRKATGASIELLLLEKLDERRFQALISPLKKIKLDEEIAINNNGIFFKVIDFNNRIIEFNQDGVLDKLNNIGHVPLPKYIKRKDVLLDQDRYQTVYAKEEGAVAAPTAGLHFTQTLLKKIKDKGIGIAFLTLHVGYGTFASIRGENISEHKMEREYFEIPNETVELINKTKRNSGRIIAVGTTTCRALEANKEELLDGYPTKDNIRGYTDLFIYPPFKFGMVDALITNFHLPKSTLYILVSAFAGLENIKQAYVQTIENRYRFLSYGDAMLII